MTSEAPKLRLQADSRHMQTRCWQASQGGETLDPKRKSWSGNPLKALALGREAGKPWAAGDLAETSGLYHGRVATPAAC